MQNHQVTNKATDPQERVRRLEDLLALAVALLAEEKGISIGQVRHRLWPDAPEQPQETPAMLLRAGDLPARVGLSKTGIYRLIQQGKFPKPMKVGARSVWSVDEISAWIRELGIA